jgi:hypothetical protein
MVIVVVTVDLRLLLALAAEVLIVVATDIDAVIVTVAEMGVGLVVTVELGAVAVEVVGFVGDKVLSGEVLELGVLFLFVQLPELFVEFVAPGLLEFSSAVELFSCELLL